ncbi:hypothetical protein HY994_04495 [Candidatus Micrarchaeota archaeon]|nr:hypothetical protein [Candidatus Micrarchaeota archaeon]
MSHDVIQVIRRIRKYVEHPLVPNSRGTLNPTNRLFHNTVESHAHGGNMPIMPNTTLSARVDSKTTALLIARLLQKMPKKLMGYYFEVHFIHTKGDIPQIHLNIQGPKIAQLQAQIHEEWNRELQAKRGPKT